LHVQNYVSVLISDQHKQLNERHGFRIPGKTNKLL